MAGDPNEVGVIIARLGNQFETSVGVEYCEKVCQLSNPGQCNALAPGLQSFCETKKSAEDCKIEVYKVIEQFCNKISDSERSSRVACEMITTTSTSTIASTTVNGTFVVLVIVIPIIVCICCVCSVVAVCFFMNSKKENTAAAATPTSAVKAPEAKSPAGKSKITAPKAEAKAEKSKAPQVIVV